MSEAESERKEPADTGGARATPEKGRKRNGSSRHGASDGKAEDSQQVGKAHPASSARAPTVGTAPEDVRLSSVKPNGWNPNRMTARQFKSLVEGMRKEGWIQSQPLLCWRKDSHGKNRQVIIDGEHRWRAATELGYTHGPVVWIDGLSEAEASALTIKLDARRGTFDPEALAKLVHDIHLTLDSDDLAVDLAMEDEQLAKLLASSEELEADLMGPAPKLTGGDEPPPDVIASIRMVQLFLPQGLYDDFVARVQELAKKYGTTTTTDTVYRHIMGKRADGSAQSPAQE